jgi:hypothetical protein
MKLNTKSLGEVQLSTPLLAEGLYFVRIRPDGAKVEPNSAKTGNVLKLTLQLLNDTVNEYESGREVSNSGHQMTLWMNISLTETENYDPNRRLKELGLAVGIPEDQLDDIELEDIVGKCMKVRLKHKPAQGEWDAKNEIARCLPIEESDNFDEPPF